MASYQKRNEQTEEDAQKEFADKLLGISHDTENTGTPLAPFLGTAFHAYAESRTKNEPNVLVEKRVEVCDLEDYGRISGSVDRFDIAAATGPDWEPPAGRVGRESPTGATTERRRPIQTPRPHCTRVGYYCGRVECTPGRWDLRAVRTTPGQ